MNKVTTELRKIGFPHPSPIVWYLAMLAYFVITAVSLVPFTLGYPLSLLAYLALSMGVIPGLLYGLGELVKVDNQTVFLARVQKTMILCITTFVVFGFLLRSLNNMIAAISGQYSLDPILYPFGRFIERAASFVFGVGAVLIRRRLPLPGPPVQEEPTPSLSRRRSPAWFFQVTGFLLAVSSFYLGLFHVIALEAFVLLITGLFLFSIGWLLRRMTKRKSANSLQPP